MAFAVKVDEDLPRAALRLWQLLHQLLSNGKEFYTFQNEFASKYYPDKLHLLSKQ
jgi:hypothetical protein